MPEDARPGRVGIHRWLSSEWEGSGVAWRGEVRRVLQRERCLCGSERASVSGKTPHGEGDVL